MGPEELTPTGCSDRVSAQALAVTAQNIPHGVIRDFVVQIFKCSSDGRSPIFSGDFDDQRFQIRTDAAPTQGMTGASNRRTFPQSIFDTNA